MPTIVFVSPKGGAGKTTAALLLATQLASAYGVTVIDADPNRPLKAWAAGGNAPPRLSVISDVDEENIIERIEEAAQKTPVQWRSDRRGNDLQGRAPGVASECSTWARCSERD
jgi:chromosome partitioning protein